MAVTQLEFDRWRASHNIKHAKQKNARNPPPIIDKFECGVYVITTDQAHFRLLTPLAMHTSLGTVSSTSKIADPARLREVRPPGQKKEVCVVQASVQAVVCCRGLAAPFSSL